MASEYSVNIRLNTSKVRKDLKDIRTDINNLNKAQSKGSKNKLSETEKELKLINTSLGLKNRALGLEIRALGISKKGLKIDTIEAKLDKAKVKADKFEFDLAKQSILLAENELKAKQKILEAEKSITKSKTTQLKIQRQMASPIGGTKFMMGSPAQRAFSGGPRSPIGGSLTLPGSPKFLANQARQAQSGLRGFDFQSALISGGFPLLFGQGPIGAVAGGLGGGVGGMFGQMGGFAGGIAATAAVQSISNTLNSVRELGNALRKPTQNLQLLTEKLSLTNTPTGDLIKKLEKLGMTSTAASILIEEFAERTGKTPEEVKAATKELEEFNKGMADLGLKVGFIVSDILGPAVALLNRLPLEGLAKFFMGRGFNFLNPGGALSPFKETLPQKKLRLEKTKGGKGKTNLPSNLQDIDAVANELIFNKEIKPLKNALEIEKLRLTTSSEKLNVMKESFELEKITAELKIVEAENEKLSTDELAQKIEKLKAQKELQEQIVENAEALANPFRELSNIIAQDIGNGIKGLIQGTETLNNVLKNVLNKLADAALNMAIFGNVGGQFERGGGGILGSIFKADGGRVRGGSSYIVGERGPELFSPGVSGMITPNNALGGSVNVSVNVDASGTSAEGDEPNAEQLGRLIGAVVQSELIKEKRPGGLLG